MGIDARDQLVFGTAAPATGGLSIERSPRPRDAALDEIRLRASSTFDSRKRRCRNAPGERSKRAASRRFLRRGGVVQAAERSGAALEFVRLRRDFELAIQGVTTQMNRRTRRRFNRVALVSGCQVSNPDANLMRTDAKIAASGLAFATMLGFSVATPDKKKATRKRPKSREETPKEGIR
jgi:hypothetical protein